MRKLIRTIVMDEELVQNDVMDGKFVQHIMVNERFVKNSAMNAKIDPKDVMELFHIQKMVDGTVCNPSKKCWRTLLMRMSCGC